MFIYGSVHPSVDPLLIFENRAKDASTLDQAGSINKTQGNDISSSIVIQI